MKTYTIELNGLYIKGLSSEITSNIPVGHNNGFHSYDKGEIETIIFTPNKNEAKKIVGPRNLNSWFKQIYNREIELKKMVIEEI